MADIVFILTLSSSIMIGGFWQICYLNLLRTLRLRMNCKFKNRSESG